MIGAGSGVDPQGGMPFQFSSAMGSGLTGRTVRGVPGGLPIYEDRYGGLSGQDQKDIALAPWNYRQGVFNRTFPLLSGLMGDSKLSTSPVGGSNSPLPGLPNRYVFSPGQIQQQVNAARGQIDQGTATEKGDIAAKMSARGFGGSSPIAQALNLTADLGGRQQGTDAERSIRMGAAGQNAQQDLSVGSLAQNQWRDSNQADIARRQSQVDAALSAQRNMASLIQALAGFGG